MVKRIKKPANNDFRDENELIIESKFEREFNQDLFDKIYQSGLELNLNSDTYEELMTIIKDVLKVKRYVKYNPVFPEQGWDFFEMYDFICFLRKNNLEVMMDLLKEFKRGKFSR